VCENLPDECEDAFKKCYSTDAMDISHEEMNYTIKVMHDLMQDMSFDDHVPKFIRHNLDSDELCHWVSIFFSIALFLFLIFFRNVNDYCIFL
jgi:hypothetical protein